MSVYSPTLRSNFRHLYADIAWYGLLAGSVLAFVNIYAARVGASALAIGLLTAGPAVVNLFFSLPAARWLEERSFITATFWSSLAQRLGYVALIFLPGLFSNQVQVAGLIGLIVLMAIPATLLAVSFNSLLADVVPNEYRAEVVGKRNALFAICQTLSTLVCGAVLDAIDFPGNYKIVFAMGALGALVSTYHLGRLVPQNSSGDITWQAALRLLLPGWTGRARLAAPAGSGLATGEPDGSVPEPGTANQAATGNGGALSRRRFDFSLLKGGYGRFMAAYLLFYTFQYLCLPLFPVAFVNRLALTDGMISLGNGLFYGCMFLVSLRLSRLAYRFGHHRLLIASTIGFSLYPLLIGLAQGVPLYLVASVVGGVVWGVLNASLINRLIERVPENSRPAGMAFHNLSLNVGILVGSLVGPMMTGWMGLNETILLGAGLRFLAGLLMIWWG